MDPFSILEDLFGGDDEVRQTVTQTPMPTYYKHYQTPTQESLWNMMIPALKGVFSGKDTGLSPTEGWWEGLDEPIRAGIMEPYEEGMSKLRESLIAGGGGTARGGMSGAAADVLKDAWQDASKEMATTGWGMTEGARMMPYNLLSLFMPQAMGSVLTSTSPTISEVDSPEYSEIEALKEKIALIPGIAQPPRHESMWEDPSSPYYGGYR